MVGGALNGIETTICANALRFNEIASILGTNYDMKKPLFILVALGVCLGACRKKYRCVCTSIVTGSVIHEGSAKVNKEEAVYECELIYDPAISACTIETGFTP